MADGNQNYVFATTGVEAVCPICYEEFCDSHSLAYNLGSKKRQRIAVEGCGHTFCLECLAAHCKVAIQENRVPVICPKVGPAEDLTACDDRHPGHHCLSDDFVKSILIRRPTPKSRIRMLKRNNFKSAFRVQIPPLESDKNEIEATTLKAVGMESGFPTIQLNKTFSTHSASSGGSLGSSDSARSATISVASSSSLSMTSLPAYWSKYLRFQRMKEDPSLLSCPACSGLVDPPVKVEAQSETIEIINNHAGDDCSTESQVPHTNQLDQSPPIPYPQVECPSCKHQFCAIHFDAHLGLTCEEFAQTARFKELDENERLVLATTKKCSHGCGARIVKVSGCDHIICPGCNQDMCYKCGTHVFLSGHVIRSCSNCKQGFVDHRHYNEYRFRLLFTLPIHLILSAVYLAMILPIMVVTCSFGCCFACGTRGWNCEQSANQMRPKIGLGMTAHVVCLPMIELIRDCGWWPHNDGDDDHE